MSISEELNKIKNAIYGREVRNAIHDGIKKTYDDASQGGNTNMEVSLARGGFQTLNERLTNVDGILNSVDSQLAQIGQYKADKSELNTAKDNITDLQTNKMDKDTDDISFLQINKNKKLLDETYLSDELKLQITGNTPVNSTPLNKGVTRVKVANNAIGVNQVDFMDKSSNLFNANDYLKGYRIDPSDGEIIEGHNWGVSGFIEIYPNTVYVSKKVGRVHYYDDNFNWVSTSAPSDGLNFTTPSDVYYIRLILSRDDEVVAQLNQGSELLPYENWYVKLSADVIPEVKGDIWTEDKYTISGVTEGDYTAPAMPSYADDVATSQATEIISLFDELVANYPQYITKSILGADGLGENIYRYDFKPEPVPIELDSTKFPKMILVAGVHGEKAGVYAQYLAMKEICESWSDNELLETLRWNVHFVVIPIVNNYGFNNITRKNENGVDIARNFPANWTYNPDPESNTYGGEEPLSELGSQYVDQVIQSNLDAIYFGSFHHFSTPPTGDHEFIWNAGATKLQTQLAKQLISRVSRKWKKEHEWLPQDDTTYFGYANGSAPNGSEGMYAASLGIQGGTFEICRRFYLETPGGSYNSTTMTFGVEAFIYWLIINLKYNVEFYNNH